jgi:hypothetical protein
MDRRVRFALETLRHPMKTYDYIMLKVVEAGAYQELLVMQSYYWFWEKLRRNTTLLDLGANMGDTAMYFGMNKNVKKIISYEPDPHWIEVCRRTIRKSPFRDRITLIGEAVVPHTLDKVLAREKNIAIKCDIEGSEHDVFDDSIDLRNVYLMIMEYHFRVGKLPSVLRAKGFKVRATKAEPVKLGFYPGPMDVGYIYAWR